MRKIFRGKLGLVGAVLVSLALVTMITGTVAAATGYVLWEGSSEITVTEAVHVYYASESEHTADLATYPHELELGDDDPLGATVSMSPGICMNTYFKITSDVSHDLLVKAVTTTSDASAMTVTFDAANLTTTGVVVNLATPLLTMRTVCVDGSADTDVYTASSGFTRESAP